MKTFGPNAFACILLFTVPSPLTECRGSPPSCFSFLPSLIPHFIQQIATKCQCWVGSKSFLRFPLLHQAMGTPCCIGYSLWWVTAWTQLKALQSCMEITHTGEPHYAVIFEDKNLIYLGIPHPSSWPGVHWTIRDRVGNAELDKEKVSCVQ